MRLLNTLDSNALLSKEFHKQRLHGVSKSIERQPLNGFIKGLLINEQGRQGLEGLQLYQMHKWKR
jgi:hypothetical protein